MRLTIWVEEHYVNGSEASLLSFHPLIAYMLMCHSVCHWHPPKWQSHALLSICSLLANPTPEEVMIQGASYDGSEHRWHHPRQLATVAFSSRSPCRRSTVHAVGVVAGSSRRWRADAAVWRSRRARHVSRQHRTCVLDVQVRLRASSNSGFG